MQLKLKRSNEEVGLIFKKTGYRLDAMLHLTDAEIENFKKHGQWKATVIPNARMVDQTTGKDDVYNQEVLAMTTFEKLTQGISFTEKHMSLIENVERYITAGVTTVKKHIDRLETYDGSTDQERVIDFDGDGPKIVSSD